MGSVRYTGGALGIPEECQVYRGSAGYTGGALGIMGECQVRQSKVGMSVWYMNECYVLSGTEVRSPLV